MKRVTGSRKTRRFRDFRVSSFGWTTESVIALPLSGVEEEILDQSRRGEHEHQDEEQPDKAHRPHHAAHPLHHLIPPHRSRASRSEEHTSELQSLMRISYAVFCLKKKKITTNITYTNYTTTL